MNTDRCEHTSVHTLCVDDAAFGEFVELICSDCGKLKRYLDRCVWNDRDGIQCTEAIASNGSFCNRHEAEWRKAARR